MNIRQTSFFTIALLGLLVSVLHALASAYSLYWRFFWFDNVVHFTAGAFLGGLLSWWIYFEHFRKMERPRLLGVVCGVLVIGVLWEAFELVTHTYGALNWASDTALDLAMDVVGAAVAYHAFMRYVR